jgi:hypothetical protein
MLRHYLAVDNTIVYRLLALTATASLNRKGSVIIHVYIRAEICVHFLQNSITKHVRKQSHQLVKHRCNERIYQL